MSAGRAVALITYHVTAKRWPLGWELHVDGVGVTQSRTLATAEKAVREYVALFLDLDDETGLGVEITPSPAVERTLRPCSMSCPQRVSQLVNG